jgi:ribosomal protein S18 acetylase RimI-like enzyme
MPELVIRYATLADCEACHAIEMLCFDPAEAASQASIRTRIEVFASGFLVAEMAGIICGFINSGATNADDLADEELKQMVGHAANGHNLVVFSLAVHPQYQGRGIARALLSRYIAQAQHLGKQRILLLCKSNLVPLYARFGFIDQGLSASTHGGAIWHTMEYRI